jgi:hypothetical protein
MAFLFPSNLFASGPVPARSGAGTAIFCDLDGILARAGVGENRAICVFPDVLEGVRPVLA